MRARVWVVLVAAVLGLAFGFIGRGTDVEALDTVAGICWLVAIILAISLLPFWSRIIPSVEPMPGLFRRPGADERWCTECGSPTAHDAACDVCGAEPRVKEPKKPKRAKAAKA